MLQLQLLRLHNTVNWHNSNFEGTSLSRTHCCSINEDAVTSRFGELDSPTDVLSKYNEKLMEQRTVAAMPGTDRQTGHNWAKCSKEKAIRTYMVNIPTALFRFLKHIITLSTMLFQPLSHTVTVPTAPLRPLNHMVTKPTAPLRPLSHMVTVPTAPLRPLSHNEPALLSTAARHDVATNCPWASVQRNTGGSAGNTVCWLHLAGFLPRALHIHSFPLICSPSFPALSESSAPCPND
jgi:hypothetical protein